MKRHFKRGIAYALIMALAITMCFGTSGPLKADAVYAADNDARHALSVYNGDKLVKKYTLADLKAIAKKEGDIKYKFSGYNRNPSFYTFGDENAYPDVKEVTGPTVAGILADAGVKYTDEQLISFAAPDGVMESFVAGDFFRERYYFPNGKIAVPYKGTPATEENYKDAQAVVPVIDLHRSDDWESVLRFGQVAPNEQNNAAYVKYVADGGSIIIGDVQTATWEAITSANYNSGVILPGTKLEFKVPASMTNKKVVAYYTTDGTEPGPGDAIYNYDKYGGLQETVLPDEEGTVTYKFKVVGYGKLDSEVTAFTYEVKDVDQPAVPTGFKVTGSANTGILYEWDAAEEDVYYEILKQNPQTGNYELFQRVLGVGANIHAYPDAEKGKTYTFKIRAVKELSSDQQIYGSASEAVTVTVPVSDEEQETPVTPDEPADIPEPPTVAKAVIKSAVKTGYGGIQVKWNKVEGADGYEVVRTDAKGNKLIKIFNNSNTVSWKNTGLKTGRKYTYKVRAYVNFDGKKVYGKYSGIRAAVPALNKPVISKLTPGSKSITVKWKKVPGANGYKIYRSTAKNGKYTCVKTIKKGGTLSWKNTKLKKGKTYYYKVKAYRIVDKKNVYSNISLSKYTKSK